MGGYVSLVPGVASQLTLQVDLSNNGPEKIEASDSGDNYAISLFLTDTDISGGQSASAEPDYTTMTNGNLSFALNDAETISFQFTLEVSIFFLFQYLIIPAFKTCKQVGKS